MMEPADNTLVTDFYCEDDVLKDVFDMPVDKLDYGVEIIVLDAENLEYSKPIFWFVFEWSWCLFFCWYIQRKSIKLLRSLGFEVRSGQEDVDLAKLRQNFSPNNIVELHNLRTRFFNYSSPLLQHFVENVANAPALDDVYNAVGSFSWNGKKILPKSAKPDFCSSLYLDCPNGQSVRNRYRKVVDLYKEIGGGKTLSIACGSAQPLIQAVYELNKEGKGGIEVTLTDASLDSLNLAMSLAQDAGVVDKFNCKQVHFLQLKKALNGEKFNVIEACGILDYLPDKHAIKLLELALGSLLPGGSIIVSNMAETRAANLLRKMYNWEILYRTPDELGHLIKMAGGKNIKVYVEPWGIHPVATAQI